MRAKLQAQETDQGLRIRVSADALFGSSPDILSDDSAQMLGDIAKLIAAIRPREVIVAGHSDGAGEDGRNLKLSQRRAHAVAAWLAAHAGTKRPKISEQGFGRTRPIAPNRNADGSDNPDGRAQNRRIEVFLKRS